MFKEEAKAMFLLWGGTILIGLIATLIAPGLFSKFGKGQHSAARAQIAFIEEGLEKFNRDIGRYPATSEGLVSLIKNPGISQWHGPYLQRDAIPNDPWGRPYHYESPGKHGGYDLYSYGADGLPGGEGINKDIVGWQ